MQSIPPGDSRNEGGIRRTRERGSERRATAVSRPQTNDGAKKVLLFEAIVDRVSISLALSRDRKWRTTSDSSDDSRPSVCLCGEQCDQCEQRSDQKKKLCFSRDFRAGTIDTYFLSIFISARTNLTLKAFRDPRRRHSARRCSRSGCASTMKKRVRPGVVAQ